MIIKDLYMQHFGKFHDRHIRLDRGMNIIYGDNEAGKSTMTSFIEAMFFGTERARGKAARKDMYSRYQPWEGGRNYEGRMTVEDNGETFRLSRNFYKEDPSFSVEHMQSGKKVSLADERIDDLFDGLTRPNFKNTLCIGQLSGRPDSQYGLSLQAQMANAAKTSTTGVDLKGALEYLKKERRQYDSKAIKDRLQAIDDQLNGTVPLMDPEEYDRQHARLEQQIKDNEARIQEARQSGKTARKKDQKQRMEAIRLLEENNYLAEEYQRKKARYNALGKKASRGDYQTLQRQWREARDTYNQSYDKLSRRNGRDLAILFSVMMFGLLILMVFFFLRNSTIYRIGACLVFAAVLIGCALLLMTGRGQLKRRTRKAREAMEQYQEQMEEGMAGQGQARERETLRQELIRLKEKYDAIQEPLQEYMDIYGEDLSLIDEEEDGEDVLEPLNREREELIRKKEQLNARKEWADRAEADRMALEEEASVLQEKMAENEEQSGIIEECAEIIRSLSEDIHGDFGQELNQWVSGIFNRMTGGKYSSVRVDEQLGIQVDDGHQFVDIDLLSQGTKDQLYLSLRLAMVHLLFGGKLMPVILDDTFASFDDSRMAETLHWLGNETGLQVIILTCHHREAAALDEMGMDYHYAEL